MGEKAKSRSHKSTLLKRPKRITIKIMRTSTADVKYENRVFSTKYS